MSIYMWGTPQTEIWRAYWPEGLGPANSRSLADSRPIRGPMDDEPIQSVNGGGCSALIIIISIDRRLLQLQSLTYLYPRQGVILKVENINYLESTEYD